uniref:Uncharacterized protein n=1 Tax=Elaeophora elaphi TaxID=1147741 RepID=A0A0R3RXI5_9BILA
MCTLREFTSDDDLEEALSILNCPAYIPIHNIVRNYRIRS